MIGCLLDKEVDIIRKVELRMDEQQKYEVIKKLVDTNGNKDMAALTLGISKRQINRLIGACKERGKAAFIHGNRGRKPAIRNETARTAMVWAVSFILSTTILFYLKLFTQVTREP